MNKLLYILTLLFSVITVGTASNDGFYLGNVKGDFEFLLDDNTDRPRTTSVLMSGSTILMDDTLCVENQVGDLLLSFDVLTNDIIRTDIIDVTLRVEDSWKVIEQDDPHITLNSDGDNLIFKDRSWSVNGDGGIAAEGTIVEAEYFLEYAPASILPDDTARVFFVYSNDCANFTGIVDVTTPVLNEDFLLDDTLCVDDNNVFIGEKSILENDSVSNDFILSLDETTLPHFGTATLSRYDTSEIEEVNVDTVIVVFNVVINEAFFDTVNVKYSYFGGASGLVDSVRYIVNDIGTGIIDSAWVFFDIGCQSMVELQQVHCAVDSVLKVDDNTCTVNYRTPQPTFVSNPIAPTAFENHGALPGTDSLLTIGEYDRYYYYGAVFDIFPIVTIDVCETFLIVEDATSPAISNCPSDINSSSFIVTWTEPTALDNCSLTFFLRTDIDSLLIPGSVFSCGTTNIEYTAIDSSGNIEVCAFDIDVNVDLDAGWTSDSLLCVSNQDIDLNLVTNEDTTGQNLKSSEYIWYLDGIVFNGVLPINSLSVGIHQIAHVLNVRGCYDSVVKPLGISGLVDANWRINDLDSLYCKSEQDLSLVGLTVESEGKWYLNESLLPSKAIDFSILIQGVNYKLEHRIENGACSASLSDTFGVSNLADASWRVDNLDTLYCKSEPDLNLVDLVNVSEGKWYLNDGLLSSSIINFGSLIQDVTYKLEHRVINGACSASLLDTFGVSDLADASWRVDDFDTLYCKSELDLSLDSLATELNGVWYLNGGELTSRAISFGGLTQDVSYEIEYRIENGACSASLSDTFGVSNLADASWRVDDFDSFYCKSEPDLNLVDLVSVSEGKWYLDEGLLSSSVINFGSLIQGISYKLEHRVINGACSASLLDTFGVSDLADASWRVDDFDTLYCKSVPNLNMVSFATESEGRWYLNESLLPSKVIEFNILIQGVNYKLEHRIENGACSASLADTFGVSNLADAGWRIDDFDTLYCKSESDLNLVGLSTESEGKWYLNEGLLSSSIINFGSLIQDVTYKLDHRVINGACNASLLDTFGVSNLADASWRVDDFDTLYCKSELDLSLDSLATELNGVWYLNDGELTSRAISFGGLTQDVSYKVEYKAVNGACSASLSDTFEVSNLADASWRVNDFDTLYCKSESDLNLAGLSTVSEGNWYLNEGLLSSSIINFGSLIQDVTYKLERRVINGACSASLLDTFGVSDLADASWRVDDFDKLYCKSELDLSLDNLATELNGVWYLNEGELISRDISFGSLTQDVRYKVEYRIENGACSASLSDTFGVSNLADASWRVDDFDSLYCKSDENIRLDDLAITKGGVWSVNNVLLTGEIILNNLDQGPTYVVEYKAENGACIDLLNDTFKVFDVVDASWDTLSLGSTYCGANDTLNLIDLPKNSNGEWHLIDPGVKDSLLTEGVLAFLGLPFSQNQFLEYRLSNVACFDVQRDTFVVSIVPPLLWEPFEKNICKYADQVNLNTIFTATSPNGVWTLEDNSDLKRIQGGILDVSVLSGFYNLTYSSSADVCSLDSTILIEVDSAEVNQVVSAACNDFIKIVSANKDSDLWINKVPENLETELLGDSILFTNPDFGNSSVRSISINDSLECTSIIDYEIKFVEQIDNIDLGEDIDLDHNERTFSILAGELPFGYEGEWIYDESAIEIDGDSGGNISGIISVSDTFELVWNLTSDVCLFVSDTVLISKKSFEISGGFSPNGDGINDAFEVIGAPSGKIILTIVNRWGQIVYESDDYKNDWYGTINNDKPLPTDTYYFTIEFGNGEKDKGVVVLKE